MRARALTLLGRDAEAERILRAAVEATTGDNRWRAYLHLDLAESCSIRRESGAVLELAARAVSIARAEPGLAEQPQFRVALLMPLCQAWVDLGREDRMADLAVELDRLARELDPELRRYVALQRANVLLALRAWGQLEAAARAALADPELSEDVRTGWRQRRGLALAEIARLDPSRLADARIELETALETVQVGASTDAHARAATLLALAELSMRARDRTSAAARLAEYAAIEPSAPDVEQRATFESLAIELALADDAPPAEATARRAELAALRERAQAALRAIRESWAARPAVPGGQGFQLFGPVRLLVGQYARLEIALEGERIGVERAIAAFALLQSTGTIARTLDLGLVDAGRLRRELLGDDATLVVVVPNALRTHVLVLGPEDAIAGVGAPVDGLQVARAESMRLLHTPPDADRAARERVLRAATAALRDQLFDGRVIAALRARPVTVVAGGELLGGLPIEALELGEDRAFGLVNGVAHAPSLPLAIALAVRGAVDVARGAVDVVVFGAPEHSASVRARWPAVGTIALDEADLRELGRPFAADRVRVFSGRAATLAALRDPELASARLLHIVTHGVSDVAREQPAGLVVDGDPDVAWYADLRALPVPRVVALWACRTQRGASHAGDDTTSHLGGAFLEARASSVFVSRADVELGPARTMARRLSREIERGAAPVEAGRALRAAVAADAATSDPYYWANVVLYGDAGRRGAARPLNGSSSDLGAGEARPASAWILGIAAAGFVALLALAVRRRARGCRC